MKNFFKPNRGETILEVLIAVSVLMLIMAPASGLYITSTRNIAVNRNDLIAGSLAEEGIEMLRNMRDTNFLRFSQNARRCWNTKPDHVTLDDCEASANKIGNGFYRLQFDAATGDVALASQGELHRAPSPPGQPPGDYDLMHPDDSNYQLTVGSSTFYRQIEIEYLDLDSAPDAEVVNEEGMRIISTVLYRTGTQIRRIHRIAILTNQAS